jgi:hypothetical protein
LISRLCWMFDKNKPPKIIGGFFVTRPLKKD